MFDILFRYIRRHASAKILESEFELIKNAITVKKIRKRQFLVQEGEVCKHFAFIVKGAMRQYLIDKKGVEHIVHLAIENWWIGDRESWVKTTPSVYCIDAWEETDLLLPDY